jgi:hypothetical protein
MLANKIDPPWDKKSEAAVPALGAQGMSIKVDLF